MSFLILLGCVGAEYQHRGRGRDMDRDRDRDIERDRGVGCGSCLLGAWVVDSG